MKSESVIQKEIKKLNDLFDKLCAKNILHNGDLSEECDECWGAMTALRWSVRDRDLSSSRYFNDILKLYED